MMLQLLSEERMGSPRRNALLEAKAVEDAAAEGVRHALVEQE